MKYVCFFLLVAYIIIGLFGGISYMYMDISTRDAAISSMGWTIAGLSVLIGTLAYILFWELYKEHMLKLSDGMKVFMYCVCLVACIFINRTMVFKFNEWFGENKTLVIEGKVIDSYRKIRRKQKVPDFYLDIKDSLTGKKYKFKVKRRIYELMVAGAKFKKEFRVGSYGIIYRKYP